MRKITINVHSFIDIITNSSTEIYVQASEHTIKNIKNMVNSILALGGSPLKCEDLFTMSLVNRTEAEYKSYGDEYPEDYEFANIDVEVKPLVAGKDAEIASKVLSSLSSLFEINESYN